MTALYITSLAECQGKTAFCAAMGRWFQEKGKKVGYLKPLRSSRTPDKDVAFLKQALRLGEPIEQLSPLSLNEALASPADVEWKVKAAYEMASRGKDLVVIEGAGGLWSDGAAAQVSLKLVESLQARVLLILWYGNGAAAYTQTAANKLGEYLVGVVINAVPSRKMAQAKEGLASELQKKGIKVLGVFPQRRSLFTVTVSELAEHLGGKLLAPIKGSGGLVENLMIGVRSFDNALLYYGRKADKASLLPADRADMQLAALQTSNRCLVLANAKTLMPFVTAEAKSKGVPIIMTPTDTLAVIEQIETLLNQARFHQKEKLDIMRELLAQYFDPETLSRVLGLES